LVYGRWVEMWNDERQEDDTAINSCPVGSLWLMLWLTCGHGIEKVQTQRWGTYTAATAVELSRVTSRYKASYPLLSVITIGLVVHCTTQTHL